jgi:hypothetical protein
MRGDAGGDAAPPALKDKVSYIRGPGVKRLEPALVSAAQLA